MSDNDKGDLLSLIDDRIRAIAREVLEETQITLKQLPSDMSNDANQLSESLARISAKEYVSIKEVALLLNCSDGHVRNLVGKAQKGKASHPIPFLDLDGVTMFPRQKLLEWASQPKRNLRAVS